MTDLLFLPHIMLTDLLAGVLLATLLFAPAVLLFSPVPLRALRCDGYIHVRRVHLCHSVRQTISTMLIEQYLLRQYRQQFIELDSGRPASDWLQDNPIQDAVSQTLQQAFAGNDTRLN